MSEILKKAQEIHTEQTKAEENAETEKLRRDRELTEAQMIGVELAQQFMQLMIEHDIPTEDFHDRIFRQRFFRNSGFVYFDAGRGWSIKGLTSAPDGDSTIPGLAIMEDSSVREWDIDRSDGESERRGKLLCEPDVDQSQKLATDEGLDLLGRKVVELGII